MIISFRLIKTVHCYKQQANCKNIQFLMAKILEILQAYVLIYLKSQHARTVNVSFQIFELPLKKLYTASRLT